MSGTRSAGVLPHVVLPLVYDSAGVLTVVAPAADDWDVFVTASDGDDVVRWRAFPEVSNSPTTSNTALQHDSAAGTHFNATLPPPLLLGQVDPKNSVILVPQSVKHCESCWRC